MSFRDQISRSRMSFSERMNKLFKRGPKVDEDFWDDLEESLILSDVGGLASEEIIDVLRELSSRKALTDSYEVLELLADTIEGFFTEADPNPFKMNPVCVLFVGINGAGKTTTVGKLAKHGIDEGRKPLIGSADTFRAAAIEQLDVWGQRSGVEVVKRERGADPASVCYDVIERAEQLGSDLVLIDTSGRLHTSDELMRELQKVVNVTRKRSQIPVKTVLVIDATTGQNGLQQAREFHKALELDGIIMTKLDGTAKGGIAVAVSYELKLPILGVGVGESIEDLQPFDARSYAKALFGAAADDEEAEESEETEAFEEFDEPDELEETGEPGEFDEPEESEVEEAPVAEEEPEVAEQLEADSEASWEPEQAEDLESEGEPELEPEPEAWPEIEPSSEEEPEAGEPAEDGLPEEPEEPEEAEPEEAEEPADEAEEAPKKETFGQKLRRWFS